ncbi:conserved domain protein [Actinomyces sp. oral taxon 170 str. F0386]|nr:conserved domain protein [Actinomyces sp. oral taxon 170 str. F0386]
MQRRSDSRLFSTWDEPGRMMTIWGPLVRTNPVTPDPAPSLSQDREHVVRTRRMSGAGSGGDHHVP